jgi:hypothetical protein
VLFFWEEPLGNEAMSQFSTPEQVVSEVNDLFDFVDDCALDPLEEACEFLACIKDSPYYKLAVTMCCAELLKRRVDFSARSPDFTEMSAQM